MNKKSDRRSSVVEKIAGHILQHGLAKTSLRQLAAAADLSDRMLLYYFKDKEDVMTSALTFLANGMTTTLEAMIPGDKKYTPAGFFAQNAALINSPAFSAFMGLWIEISAAAVRGEQPFKRASHEIASDFLKWIENRLDIADPNERTAQAAMLLSMIDGLMLTGICIDEETQQKAMTAMIETLETSTLK